jgi:hypothetical protein
MVNDVNILNVLSVSPLDMAMWLNTEIINKVKLPSVDANKTLDPNHDIMPLLPDLANKVAFVTELYCMCVAAKPLTVKISGPEAASNPLSSANIMAKIDMTYRAIQTLESMRETLISMKSYIQFRSQYSL